MLMTRTSKLQRSNFFLNPKQMMKNLHSKTHFKAAISISRGDACCVKVEQHEFGDQFAEIARNIEAMNRSGDFGSALHGHSSKISHYLQKKRNCASQGGSRRISINQIAVSAAKETCPGMPGEQKRQSQSQVNQDNS